MGDSWQTRGCPPTCPWHLCMHIQTNTQTSFPHISFALDTSVIPLSVRGKNPKVDEGLLHLFLFICLWCTHIQWVFRLIRWEIWSDLLKVTQLLAARLACCCFCTGSQFQTVFCCWKQNGKQYITLDTLWWISYSWLSFAPRHPLKCDSELGKRLF